jgi:hypothetical protein
MKLRKFLLFFGLGTTGSIAGKILIKFSLLTLFLSAFVATTVYAQSQFFGVPGRSGADGRYGRNGLNGQEQVIRVGNQAIAYDLSGGEGDDAENGALGENASQCQQPEESEFNLIGAQGGNGGNGGNGGSGGTGGKATIYFDELSQLRNVSLKNSGGRPRRGGLGAQAGSGCTCQQPSWTVSYCVWERQSQPLKEPNQAWKAERQRTSRCTGNYLIDKIGDIAGFTNEDQNYRYRWRYVGLDRESLFTCVSGAQGQNGRNGSDGLTGAHGRVWLVQGNSIPTEKLNHTEKASTLSGKNIQFVKNNWLEKSGLGQLLAPGSNVHDNYLLIETKRRSLNLVWSTGKSFADLGDPMIEAAIATSGNLDLSIPGTLESTVENQKDSTVVKITNGINPNRLKRFKFKGFYLFKDPSKIYLEDQGNLLNELRKIEVTVGLYDRTGNQIGNKLKELKYAISPNTQLPKGIYLANNSYTFDFGESLNTLLKPNQPMAYVFSIRQTTKSGATYDSGLRVKFVVGKINTNPEVEAL